MSIPAGQMMAQIASVERASPAVPAAAAAAPGSARAAISSTPTPTNPSAPVSTPSSFSTDLQIDSHHQVYYAVVDERSGDVLFEIPSEALRNIGESLNVPLIGDASVPSVDVKS